ncbi:MAG: hypothetical protein ACYTBP_06155 [Planctomycetota bacterium]|jgi:hypothetical protein
MKQFYKNPISYYILVPVLTAMWPLLVWGFYLPGAETHYEDEETKYVESKKVMDDILNLDPDRLKASDKQNGAVKFEYPNAINEAAGAVRIKYSLSSRPTRKKVQSAHVVLEDVKIVQVAEFLTKLQVRWADLQCQKIALTKNKDKPDAWKADIDFKYYY